MLTLCVVVSAMCINAQQQSPVHEIIKGKLVSSDRYYPGTERDIEVYVPQAYDGMQPACLYVGLDGILCNAPQVMDSLISAGKMPVTIGVFIQPGVIKDASGNVLRYNRSNEFDMTSEKFACFIEDEVLPWVERLTTAKGAKIRLSHRGTDAMIFGLSSGGIAAFTTAWHRPDLFSRVFSGVGTFVAMRGGNDLQAIVRKSEPSPLRVFLQDGTNDVWNALFGHWYEGNRMLASALDFAGYDARYDWSDCYHGVKRASEVFADVIEWMWHDWPQAPAIGTTHNNLLDTMLIAGSEWRISQAQESQTLEQKSRTTCLYPNGTLEAEVLPSTNCLWQYTIDADGNKHNGQPFYWLHCYDNSQLTIGAMAFDGAGDLWVVTNAGIQICDQNGRVRGILMLPRGLKAEETIEIGFGNDELLLQSSNGITYRRQLHVTPPIPGVTPKSQGQG